MQKSYVLLEIGFEYNDEIYYCSENSAGHPQSVFLDLETAKQVLLKKNIEKFQNLFSYPGNLSEYCYEADDLFNRNRKKDFNKFLEKHCQCSLDVFIKNFIYHGDDEKEGVRIKDCLLKLSQEEWATYASFFNLTFFTLAEVEIVHPLS